MFLYDLKKRRSHEPFKLINILIEENIFVLRNIEKYYRATKKNIINLGVFIVWFKNSSLLVLIPSSIGIYSGIIFLIKGIDREDSIYLRR